MMANDRSWSGNTLFDITYFASTDHGASFSILRIDDPTGPGRSIAAQPFVGPNGEVYAAWNDIAAGL